MKRRNRILIVDDTEMNRAMLADILSAEYDVIEASNGKEAIEVLRQQQISLVMLDIIMPEMDGFEVLAVMNENGWIGHVPVITISAETSSTYIDHAYDLGATDYISRPFDAKTVQHRVRNTMMLYSKQKMLEDMVLEQIVEKEKNNFLMVEILSNIVEFRNGESGLHVLHIRVLTEIFLRKLQEITDRYPLSGAQIALIVNASAMHDVGKISISEVILNKPDKLTPEEFEIMKTHSMLGAEVMKDALQRHHEELLRLAYHICRWHHERYDGSGYPDGLKEDAIPIEAQVVALADVYDALTSKRVYKPAYAHDRAIQMIVDGECGAFNPLLIRCLKEVGEHLNEELKIRSQNGVVEENLQMLSKQIGAGEVVSGRTLTLLEQERVKYQFFASMSNEIQFEYSYKTDVLSMSEWGAHQLGLPVLIEHPEQNPTLHQVFSLDCYYNLQRKLRQVTPQNPIVNETFSLRIKGKERWYKATARPLWDNEETNSVVEIIGKFVDVHEEQMKLNKLKMRAERDCLTGLSNHATAKKLIQALLCKEDRHFALILLDLDDFKSANDQRGHMFGDCVLKFVAGKIQGCVRDSDVVARVGGDEFLLCLEYKGKVEAVVNRIFQEIHGTYQKFQISISMGVALSPEDSCDYDTLFHAADQALYAAKQSGKDRYLVYNDNMSGLLSVLSPMEH